MRVLAWVLVVCASLLTSRASAQTVSPAAAPPDVVVLVDGSLFRGALVERSSDRVVLMLATGETRTWAASDVESAGRDTSVGEPAIVQAPTETARASLHVRAPRSDLTLHLLDTSVSVPIAGRFEPLRFDAFHALCVAPCDVAVEVGTYTLGISRGDGSPQRAGPPIALSGEQGLTLEHEERSGLRAAGWTLVFAGPVVFGGLAVLAAALDWLEPGLP